MKWHNKDRFRPKNFRNGKNRRKNKLRTKRNLPKET